MFKNCTYCSDTFEAKMSLEDECPACREVLRDCKSVWREDRLQFLKENMAEHYSKTRHQYKSRALVDMIEEDDSRLAKFEFRLRNVLNA